MFGLAVGKCLPLVCILFICFQDVFGEREDFSSLEEDDIIEWEGEAQKNTKQFGIAIWSNVRFFYLKLKPYERKITLYGNRKKTDFVVEKFDSAPFKVHIRVGNNNNFSIYFNYKLKGSIRVTKRPSQQQRNARIFGTVKTISLTLLSIEDIAARLNMDGCGQPEDKEELEDSLNNICQLDKISDKKSIKKIKKTEDEEELKDNLNNICQPDKISEKKFARIVKGKPASPTSHPWQAAIRYKPHKVNQDRGDIVHRFGATLINECWAVTAAHCFKQGTGKYVTDSMVIRVGDYFNNDADPDHNKQFSVYENVQDLEIEKVIKHEGYKESHKSNDIALIKLKKPCAKFGRFVKPVCLPDSSGQSIYKGKCTITGWGRTEHGQDNKNLPKCLQQAEVNIKTREECKCLYTGSEFYKNDVMLCAGGVGGVDACQGDSGGPLVCANDKRAHTLVGVTSWGVKCGDETHPGVYTRLPSFMKWIYIQMKFEHKSQSLQ